jgi:DNA polymerase III gamma/tau subunit
MLAGTNSDFELFGDGEKTPNIEDVRAMRSRSFIRSGDAGFKVFIIANADKLNHQSQNVLLKVLEEPLNTVFILTCENYMDLLQTVRSRCTVYHLEPLDCATIERHLSVIPGYTDEDYHYAALNCDGSIENAENILKNGECSSNKAARLFAESLGDELDIYKAAAIAGELSREDYLGFCLRFSLILSDMIKERNDSPRLISIYEYLQTQINTMSQNPSVSALSGALAAFCGELFGGK